MPIRVICHICGTAIQRDPNKIRRNIRFFCSKACTNEWRKTRKGTSNPRWRGGEVSRKCLGCSKTYLIARNRIPKSKFCSVVCLAKSKFSGDKNPRWKGGVSKHRDRVKSSSFYKEWRSKVFRRDRWTCQVCEYRGRDIEAHHIKRWTDFPRLTFRIWNGITLCKPCHDKTYGKEEKFEKSFFRKILIDYTPSILRKKVKI